MTQTSLVFPDSLLAREAATHLTFEPARSAVARARERLAAETTP